MFTMSWHPVLFLNETASGWSREENWALEGRQEQRARQKEEVKNSSFTIHSNRPDVRMMNGAFYPISNATEMGVRMHGFNKIEGTAKSGKIGRISHHAKYSMGW
jgi:hypothetical protein